MFEHYSPVEISALLKVNPRAVRQWVYDGRFPAGTVIQLPRGLRILGSALNEFVADRTL